MPKFHGLPPFPYSLLPISPLPGAKRLPWRQPDRPVEPDDLAVEHLVLDDVFDEIGVLLGPAEPLGERCLFAQRVAGIFWQTGHHRGVKDARGDGHDPDATAGELARDGEGKSDDATFGRGVGHLPDLAVESGHACRVDDDTALSALRGIAADHSLGGEPDDVEGADEVDLHDLRERVQRVRSFSSEDLLRAGDPGAVYGAA